MLPLDRRLGPPCFNRFRYSTFARSIQLCDRKPQPARYTHCRLAARHAAISDSCHETATPCPQPSLRCCPPLVMRNATSMTYRRRRVTDEAFRSQEGEPTAGFSGFKCFAPSRLWLSEASLRALAGVGSIPAGNLVGLGPQSKCFFAWLNCGSGMPIAAFWGARKTL